MCAVKSSFYYLVVSETFDSTRKYLKIEPRMLPPIESDEFPDFVMAGKISKSLKKPLKKTSDISD